MPPVDIELLIDVLLRVSSMACELPWIQEMDINPLIMDEHGIVAVDARIVVDYPKLSTDPYDRLAIHPYPIQLVKRIQLNDGTDIVVRPIRPEDAEIEQAFVRSLSAESRYFRFMNTMQELSLEMLVRFTQIDYHNEMALIAVKQEDNVEVQIGVGRYMTNPDKRSCEFALAISDEWQGRGIGRQLMRNLEEVARDRGLEKIEGQVLGNNFRMLHLMTSLGYTTGIDEDESGVKVVAKRLN